MPRDPVRSLVHEFSSAVGDRDRAGRTVRSQQEQLLTAGSLFTHPELQAMARDGLVKSVYGRSYLMATVAESPALRALAAVQALPAAHRERATLGRGTAAWIFGCSEAPEKLSVLTDRRRRTTALRPFSDAVLHEVALGPLDVVRIGGVRVTTPMRTAMDVALHGSDVTAPQILRKLGMHPQLGCSLQRVSQMLEAVPRAPGKTRALVRLRTALDESGPVTSGASGHQ